MKIRPLAAELFLADGQTHVTKPVVAFRTFGNTPKNEVFVLIQRDLLAEQAWIDPFRITPPLHFPCSPSTLAFLSTRVLVLITAW
jgi:hypothetical protein